jgi:hypothetical protein
MFLRLRLPYHLTLKMLVVFEYLVYLRHLQVEERLLLERREQGTFAQPEVHQQEVVLE